MGGFFLLSVSPQYKRKGSAILKQELNISYNLLFLFKSGESWFFDTKINTVIKKNYMPGRA